MDTDGETGADGPGSLHESGGTEGDGGSERDVMWKDTQSSLSCR